MDNALRYGLRGLEAGSSLPQLLAKERGARNPSDLPPLTEEQILTWADAYHGQTGKWPVEDSGPISDTSGEVWKNVDAALRLGFRGMPGGSSLAKLIADRRVVRNRASIPLLTEDQILGWADAHRARTGQWPGRHSGPIAEAPGETWDAVEAALSAGCRGLSSGGSLARLLSRHRGKRNRGDLRHVTVEEILAGADAHQERTGQWPTAETGPVTDAPGETWKGINLALATGLRGLPGADSLYWLLRRHREVPGRRSKLERRGRKRAVRRRHRAAELRARGYTLQEIADHLGVTRQAVAGYLDERDR